MYIYKILTAKLVEIMDNYRLKIAKTKLSQLVDEALVMAESGGSVGPIGPQGPAGTTGAGSGQLKFDSGSILNTAEAGVMGYDGVSFYATIDQTNGRGIIPVEQSLN